MEMRRLAAGCVVAAAAVLVRMPARAQSTTYTVVDLGASPGYGGTLSDINESGTVVGTAYISQSSSTYSVPFVIEKGVLTQLPFHGTAVALNDAGDIVGTNTTTNHGYKYANGTAIELDRSAVSSAASGINASGDVAGSGVAANGSSHAFLYQSGTLQTLPFSLVSPVLNDAAIMAGDQIYSGGVLIPYSTVRTGQAHHINKWGDVVGQTGSPYNLAFWLSSGSGGGTLFELGTLPGFDTSTANDITDAFTIVGTAVKGSGESRGFIRTNGGAMTDLNTLATPPSGYVIAAASAINESGYVAAVLSTAGQTSTHFALLVPTASPKAPSITRFPETVTALAGTTATFYTSASGAPLPTYQWQVSMDHATTWTNLVDDGTFAGTTTPRLSIAAAANEYFLVAIFRAVATNAAGSAATGSVRLAVVGTPVAPAITTQPVSTFTSTRSPAGFTVVATGTSPLAYQWRRNGTLIPGAVYPTLNITLAQAAHAGTYTVTVSNSAGSVTSSSAALTVATVTYPGIAGLMYGAQRSGANGPVFSTTPALTVAFALNGPSLDWTVKTFQNWLVVSTRSGSGSGRLTIGIEPSLLPAGASAIGTVELVGQGWTLPFLVLVTIQSSPSSAGPFGSFDTPTNESAVAGSIAITGWSLDDIGVDHVELWRDRVVGETTPPFTGTPADPRNGKIFIANATFVPGARPDLDASYSAYPASAAAGWGYLLLTHGLWNQGNGTYTLYAFALDQDAHVTTLGNKVIRSDNAHASKPFGSIDTPAQGATVSGIITNYGWALTPGTACTVAGGSVKVSIDSGPLQPVTYGGARTDIAAGFPGYTDASAAGGSYALDTTALSNGAHTIAWSVTDSCGRTDGVGSRFFTVANVATGVRAAVAVPPAAQRISWTSVAERIDGDGWSSVTPDRSGRRQIAVGLGHRLELQIPSRGRLAGRVIVNGQARPLPIGSTLSDGVFMWQPAPGFLGPFDLEFVDEDGTVTRVRVVVRAA